MSTDPTAPQAPQVPPAAATPEAKPAAPAATASPAPAAKPAAAPPPPPDPAVIAWGEELQKILGPSAKWELSGKLPAFRVAPGDLREASQKLKENGFDYCLLVTAADYPAQNRFEMVYALTRYSDGREVALVSDVNRAEPTIPTVSDLWPTAEWHEREVFDLFGIHFQGHGDLRRILLDDTWEGHPLRKDYVDQGHQMVKRPY